MVALPIYSYRLIDTFEHLRAQYTRNKTAIVIHTTQAVYKSDVVCCEFALKFPEQFLLDIYSPWKANQKPRLFPLPFLIKIKYASPPAEGIRLYSCYAVQRKTKSLWLEKINACVSQRLRHPRKNQTEDCRKKI